jgi:hypothetical protein
MSQYQEITPISRDEAEKIISGSRSEDIPLTLVRLAYFDPEWQWVQDLCITLSGHQNKWVRRTCAICFNHLARIHGTLDRDKVNPVLKRLLNDPEVCGEAEDSMEGLDIFLK